MENHRTSVSEWQQDIIGMKPREKVPPQVPPQVPPKPPLSLIKKKDRSTTREEWTPRPEEGRLYPVLSRIPTLPDHEECFPSDIPPDKPDESSGLSLTPDDRESPPPDFPQNKVDVLPEESPPTEDEEFPKADFKQDKYHHVLTRQPSTPDDVESTTELGFTQDKYEYHFTAPPQFTYDTSPSGREQEGNTIILPPVPKPRPNPRKSLGLIPTNIHPLDQQENEQKSSIVRDQIETKIESSAIPERPNPYPKDFTKTADIYPGYPHEERRDHQLPSTFTQPWQSEMCPPKSEDTHFASAQSPLKQEIDDTPPPIPPRPSNHPHHLAQQDSGVNKKVAPEFRQTLNKEDKQPHLEPSMPGIDLSAKPPLPPRIPIKPTSSSKLEKDDHEVSTESQKPVKQANDNTATKAQSIPDIAAGGLYPLLNVDSQADPDHEEKTTLQDDTEFQSEFLQITFDVLLHPSARKEDTMTLLRLHCMGNHEAKKIKLEIQALQDIRNEKKYRGYLRYVVSAHLPQKWLKESHRLQYIYELSSDGRSWKSEYWHDTANDTHHRVLSFKETELRKLVLREQKRCEKSDSSSRPTVDVYDGVILRDSRISIRKVFSPGIDQSVLLSTIEPVCEQYFPNLTEEKFSIDQFIHKFKTARKTFYKRYFDSRNISEDEITSRYIEIMLSHIEDGIERQEDYLSRVITLIITITPVLERNPKSIKTAQYVALIDAITPPADREEQKAFSIQLTFLLKLQHDSDHLRNTVITFCKTAMDVLPVREMHWMLCVPLIHFLSGQKPFDVIRLTAEGDYSGDQGMDDIINTTRKKLAKSNHFPFWKKYQCLFKLDTLLPVTLAACVPPRRLSSCFVNTNWVSPDIVLTLVVGYLRRGQWSVDGQLENQLSQLLVFLVKDTFKETKTGSMSYSSDPPNLIERFHTTSQSRLAAEQLCSMLNQQGRASDLLLYSALLVVVTIGEEGRLVDCLRNVHGDMYSHLELDESLSKVTDVVQQLFIRCDINIKLIVQTAQTCMDFEKFGVSAEHSKTLTKWKNFISDQFRKSVSRVKPSAVLRYYCQTGKHISAMEDLLTEFLEEKMEEAYAEDPTMDFWKGGASILKIYSSTIEKRYNSRPPGCPLYRTALDWHIVIPGLTMLVKGKATDLTVKAMKILEDVRSELGSFIDRLLTGDTLIIDYNIIRNKQNTLEMFVMVLGFQPLAVQEILQNGYQFIAKSKVICESLACFLNTIDEEIQEEAAIRDYLSLCDNADTTIANLSKKQQSLLSDLGISIEDIDRISRCMKSRSFRKIWSEQKNKTSSSNDTFQYTRVTVSWNDLKTIVWKPAFDTWSAFGRSFKSGDISLEQITTATGIQSRDKNILTDMLRTELSILDHELPDLRLGEVIETRLAAVSDVLEIESSAKIAKSILKVKETFQLTGDFSSIATGMENTGIALGLVNRQMIEMSKVLASLPSEMNMCLESFNKCRSLVQWLRENMKGGQNDIKTFVDLALIAVGESDLDIAVIRNFHSAALGYSRLIFMPIDCAAADFVERLWDVAVALLNDPDLHKKLDETQAGLSKLKNIHKTQHTTSTKKSLRQARHIVRFGTCYVGYDIGDEDNTMGLQTVIRIDVERKGGIMKFTFDELKDIQNRLMLAGNSEDLDDPNIRNVMSKEEIIEKFTMIFDSLRRLGMVYIQLRELGCTFFRQMDVAVHGDTEGTEVCKISWYDQAASLTVYVLDHATIDITEHIKCLATAFETCLEEWKDELSQARKDFYFLNYFTNKQLILLQKMNAAPTSKKLDKKVILLLSLVLPGCSQEQMARALVKTRQHSSMPGLGYQQERESMMNLIINTVQEATAASESTANIDVMASTFHSVWTVYMKSLTKLSSDFLDFRRLGECLQDLAMRIPRDKIVNRTLPEPLRKDEPNLIVCPEADIINATLTVYMLDKNKNTPLPRPEEILMCTSETSADEVEAFLRRSLQQTPIDQKNIFVMMHADQLSIDVACEADHFLKLLKANNKNDCQLVIFSSKENENKSVLAATLEKYQRRLGILSTEIKDYMRMKLQSTGRAKVCIIMSKRAGEGKTHFKNKMLKCGVDMRSVGIPMQDRTIDREQVMCLLEEHTGSLDNLLLHVDIAPTVQYGVDHVLFQLVIVGCLASRSGVVWLNSEKDSFIVECLESSIIKTSGKAGHVHTILSILPAIRCLSPTEYLQQRKEKGNGIGFCDEIYRSETYQVPYDHLRDHSERPSMENCIETFLGYCGIDDPSWAELKQFVSFLYVQLTAYKNSVFCSSDMEPDLPGFGDFVKRFLIQMSQDFATRSLDISEESGEQGEQNTNKDLQRFQMKRKWETSPHPYLFFNEDETTITFLGFNLRKGQGGGYDLVDDQSDNILVSNIMTVELFMALVIQGVPLSENIGSLSRLQRIEKICSVMGIKTIGDPDINYELTSDNMKKMLAIYMRFKCNIPVIIMGETGCGKTSLVKFMCQLQCPTDHNVRNMILMKVHGGTTKKDIMETVRSSDMTARENVEIYGPYFFTVVFFDEANTTEAINFIKEIICDNTMNGKKLELTPNLKFIAACNPYRKHSTEMIKRLEKTGLGYHVKQEETTDKLGLIPMRHLVYRVQPLPQSMLPLVWDFGQLDPEMEKQYIEQMVAKESSLQISHPQPTNVEDVRIKNPQISKQYTVKEEDRQRHTFSSTPMNRLPRSVSDAGLRNPIASDESSSKAEDSETFEFSSIRQRIKALQKDEHILGMETSSQISKIQRTNAVDFGSRYSRQPTNVDSRLRTSATQYTDRKKQDYILRGDRQLTSVTDADRKYPGISNRHSFQKVDKGTFGSPSPRQLTRNVPGRLKMANTPIVTTTDTHAAPNMQHNDVATILLASQSYMRGQKNECSFVSLRDVQRTIQVMTWFMKQETLLNAVEEKMKTMGTRHYTDIEKRTRSLVLALGVCYRAALKDKHKYTMYISSKFGGSCPLPGGAERFEQEIRMCQEVILDNSIIGPNIARNQALCENIFLMTVCAELRIPLFLVGKPGSSKSLAKAILSDTMQGSSSNSGLFKEFKQAQLLSYQCSPLSTSEGIIRTFDQASEFQKSQDLQQFVSIVVLDEIGLAEDLPHMPLKALHPLLEDGTDKDYLAETSKAYKKVGFIGISNWALDPAKMNRGILVQRNVPSVDELIQSALGICETDESAKKLVAPYLSSMAKAYIQLTQREFFGLRDFYGLIKMLYAFVAISKKPLTQSELKHAILRNFGGLDDVKPMEIFQSHVQFPSTKGGEHDPDCSQLGLIKAALDCNVAVDGLENRYILLLIENYSFLPMLQHQILSIKNLHLTTIFGSSFPKDQEYTQICRNINRIKVCMESGQAVLLLNLDNLYESLYDVLNQYYVHYGGEKYVDLGLGTNRMKCKVHPNFRLILVAEKQTVYKTFPIPLINRLEKHLVRGDMLLTDGQLQLSKELDSWIERFNRNRDLTSADVFIGYSTDMSAVTVLKVRGDNTQGSDRETLEKCKEILIKTCTPDGILRLQTQAGHNKVVEYQDEYFNGMHDSIVCLLDSIKITEISSHTFIQVTTFSKLLPATSNEEICSRFRLHPYQVGILNVKSFDTDQEFCRKIRDFVVTKQLQPVTRQKVLILQCDSGDQNSNLIGCARQRIQDVMQDPTIRKEFIVCVLLVIQLPNIKGGCFKGFQSGKWQSVHIDDINQEDNRRDLKRICQLTYAELLEQSHRRPFQENALLDTVQVIKNSLCISQTKIKDLDTMPWHGLKRFNHLMDLILPKTGVHITPDTLTFADGIVNVVLSLQKQKENEMVKVMGQAPKIAREACDPVNVRRAGTFRRSVARCIETRFAVVLTYVIAYMDTNQNLDLLTRSTSQDDGTTWADIFFLKVLNNSQSLILNYKNLLTSEGKESSLFYVGYTGYQDRPFQAQMPFSWILFEHIDKVYRRLADDKQVFTSEVAKVVATLSIMKDLEDSVTSEEERREACRLYLHDFICMTCQCDTDNVRQILETTFHQARKETGLSIDAPNLSLNLVNIHHIKSIVCKRLESFQMLRKTWLECDTYVEGQLQKTGNEVMCDVLALQGVVKDISTTCSSRNTNRWMSRIDAATPQISTMLKTDGNIRYGRQCVELLASIRNEWNRVLALKMFHEEVIVKSETQIDLNMKKVFKSLSKCSLRDVQGLIVIEEFIKAFQKTVPVTDRQLMELFGRCLGNFYMRVVSQLCFADNSPPSDAVIDKLLTHMTSGISETGVDVVRTFSTGTGKETIAKSFFLQLLLRTRGDLVKRHIESFFGKTRTCFMNQIKGMVGLKSKQTTRLLEFCSMVVKCIEDSYTSQLSEHSQSFTHYVTEARKKLTWASQQTLKPGLHYSNLEIIANKQFGLKMTSTILQKCFVAKTEEVSEDIMALLSVTKGVCKEGGSDYPHKYLIRNVCDRYGISSYQCLTKSLTSLEGDFSWFPLYYNADENPECEHRYLVCGPDYLKARNQIKTMILRLLQNQDAASPYPGVEGKMQTIYLALAVHREVTFSYLQRTGLHQSGIPRMIREIFKRTNLAQTIKTHIADLVSNETGKNMTYLNIREGLDLHHQGIICLLEHLYVLCLVFKDSNSFISPLIQIVLEPESMLLSYFPTMPQEVDYKQMLAEIQRADPSATFNVCPNGHPYIIADCGRPWYTTNCPECGETIGGKHHRFEGSNKKLTESDLEKDPSIDQGHVLGDPSLSSSSRAVRNLTPVTSSMLRLFTHAALLLGAEKYPQHVLRMIKPSLVSGELQTFLVGHLKNDLDHLHKGLDRSHDDVLLLCHYALDVISQGCIAGSLRSSKKTLRSPEARTTWENNIQSSVFCRITKDLTGILQRCREVMKGEDEASGTSLELKALLEQDFRIDNNACLENVQESCILWKRHARISVEGFIADVLSNRMSGKQDSRTLLEHFISKLEKIELVKYLPDILDLQRTLLNRFKRRMDKRDAKTMNIRQFLEEMKARFYLEENYMNGIKKQIDLCSEVWEKMSEYLKDYGLVVNKKGYTIKRIVPASIRMSPITYESPVEVLFPSFDGLGLCAFVLVEFLIRTQNELLQEYCRISKFRYEEIPLVSPKDITYSNVITVDKNVHFLPLLLSNCKYEVDAEQGQSFEYDKEGIERQVKDQFISGRSRIDIKNIPTMMYRSETAETWSYRRLTEVVPQAPMTGALKDLILADLRTIPQLYQAIDNLDMTISLLCCLPEQTDNPEQSLFKFMTKTLRMPNTELGQEVERSCKFKHVLSLWLVLSMKKDFFLHQNNQETFPCLEMKYKTAKLDRKKKAKYECFLNTLTKAQQRQLTEALYECIVIRFPNDETDDEQLDYSNMSVSNSLYGHVSAPIYDERQTRMAAITLLDEDDETILNFPPEIEGTMAVSAWSIAMEWFQSGK